MIISFEQIPTYDIVTGTWSETDFSSQADFAKFLDSVWSDECKYGFTDETSIAFREKAVHFEKNKCYTFLARGSKERKDFWRTEGKKCVRGVIVKQGEKTWYLTRDYYFFLNYCQFANKEKGDIDTFPDIRDIQYHLALYEKRAEAHHLHSILTKKRQMASSLFHCAKILNKYWFDRNAINKLFASDEKFLTIKDGIWKFLVKYKDFLNEHTDWIRYAQPEQEFSWMQQKEIKTKDGQKLMKGRKSVISGISLKINPTNGVGGACHPRGTKILMSSGEFKNIEDVSVGEYVLGIDNNPKKVVRLFNGFEDIYEVQQLRGETYRTTGEHLLYLINRDKKVSEKNNVRLTKTSDWDNLTPYQKRCYVGVKNYKPLNFYNNIPEPEIDPYFIGVWLGDGYRGNNNIIVNKTRDLELYQYLEKYALDNNLPLSINRKEEERYNDEMYVFNFSISDSYGENSFITRNFVKYNLYYNKQIPREILKGSVKTRLQLLAGLIDTDGHLDQQRGAFKITSKYKKFILEVQELVRSLGGITRYRLVPSQEHVVNGRKISYSESFELNCYFSDASIIPTKIPRKKSNRKTIRNIHTSPIRSVKNIGTDEYFGIECEDHLYYLEDLTITHNCAYGYHEEAGIAPKLDATYGFFRPAVEAGIYTTGMFIAAGSVGDLKQCQPLKKYMFAPKGNKFLAVKNHWVNKARIPTETGLYIPEHWGMPGFVDKNGNSLIEEAFEYLTKYYEDLKNNPEVSPQDYQLEISQHPIYLDDAFKHRDVSEFNTTLLQNQQERIELKDRENKWSFKPQKGLLEEKEGKVVLNTKRGGEEHKYPIKPEWKDKRGVVTIYEAPDENPEFFTYFAGVDTIEADETTTSESVFSIDIFKTVIEVKYRDTDGKIKTRIEGDKLVATYRGRFGANDGGAEATNEQGWLLLKMYNAFAFVERSKPNFINYMQRNGRAEKYLAKESDVPMFKDLNIDNGGGKSKFGFVMSPNRKDDNMWKLIKAYIKEYLSTEYDKIYKGDTEEVLKVIRGVDKIDDYWLLEELIQFNADGNFDRVVSFGAAVMIAKIYQQNRFIKRRNEVKDERPKDTYKQPRQQSMLGGGKGMNALNNRKKAKPRSML